jgi:hypothetical protein
MSVSATYRLRRGHSSVSNLQGIVRRRLGQNPELHGMKSASKTSSGAIRSAAYATRSRIEGIGRGFFSAVLDLGTATRLAGNGRSALRPRACQSHRRPLSEGPRGLSACPRSPVRVATAVWIYTANTGHHELFCSLTYNIF